MDDNLIFIMDYKNNYPPLWELSGIHKMRFYIFSLLFISYWIFIYYYRSLNSITAIIIGYISVVLFMLIHYYIHHTPFVLHSTKNRWITYKTSTSLDYITNLSSLKTKNQVDINKDGYAISKEYFEKLKKKQKVISMSDIGKLDDSENPPSNVRNEYLTDLVDFRAEKIGFQGFCLITILFTILSLTWNVNKKLFKRIFTLFLQATALCIPVGFLWFWWYDNIGFINVIHLKTTSLFLATSITLAIIIEILSLHSI